MDTTAIPQGFRGAAARLTQGDVDRAAQQLGIADRIVEAIASVEAKNLGFLPDGRPQLLYEAHVFHGLTGGRFDQSYPQLSSPIWNPSLYGAEGAHQYDRLDAAMKLDVDAAMQSATWGMFQLLGRNYQSLGYGSIDEFVAAMCESEGRHLEGFVTFCEVNHLTTALQQGQWRDFAEGYNGPGAPNLYASKLLAAVNSGEFPPLPSGPPPGPAPSPPPDPQPAPSAQAIDITLRRGMEMVIPGVRGLTQDGQPFDLETSMFVSADAQVASAAVSGADSVAGQTIVIPGSSAGETTVVCGQVLTFKVRVEDPALARIVIDMAKAVVRPQPTAAVAAALMGMMIMAWPMGEQEPAGFSPPIIERPVMGKAADTMWENKKISPVSFPGSLSEGERLCLADARQPAFAIARCLRWVHAR